MMTQRNVELQLQALDLIEKNQLAQSTADEGDDRSADASSDPGWVYGGSPSVNLSYAIAGKNTIWISHNAKKLYTYLLDLFYTSLARLFLYSFGIYFWF